VCLPCPGLQPALEPSVSSASPFFASPSFAQGYILDVKHCFPLRAEIGSGLATPSEKVSSPPFGTSCFGPKYVVRLSCNGRRNRFSRFLCSLSFGTDPPFAPDPFRHIYFLPFFGERDFPLARHHSVPIITAISHPPFARVHRLPSTRHNPPRKRDCPAAAEASPHGVLHLRTCLPLPVYFSRTANKAGSQPLFYSLAPPRFFLKPGRLPGVGVRFFYPSSHLLQRHSPNRSYVLSCAVPQPPSPLGPQAPLLQLASPRFTRFSLISISLPGFLWHSFFLDTARRVKFLAFCRTFFP